MEVERRGLMWQLMLDIAQAAAGAVASTAAVGEIRLGHQENAHRAARGACSVRAGSAMVTAACHKRQPRPLLTAQKMYIYR